MAETPRDFDMINKQIQLARTQAYAAAELAKRMMPNPPGMVRPRDTERFTKDRLRQLKGGY